MWWCSCFFGTWTPHCCIRRQRKKTVISVPSAKWEVNLKIVLTFKTEDSLFRLGTKWSINCIFYWRFWHAVKHSVGSLFSLPLRKIILSEWCSRKMSIYALWNKNRPHYLGLSTFSPTPWNKAASKSPKTRLLPSLKSLNRCGLAILCVLHVQCEDIFIDPHNFKSLHEGQELGYLSMQSRSLKALSRNLEPDRQSCSSGSKNSL